MFKPTPLLSVCLLLAALPATAANIYVKAGESLQVALNVALPGDVITLQAGATFTGSFTLPNKSGSGTIRIESSALANLPNARVKPSDAVNMPKIVAPNGSPAITAASGAHDYVLAGLEITVAPGVYSLGVVQLGWGTETTLAAIPYNITVERCYIHGDPTAGGKRGVALNSRSTIVRQSWVSDFKSTWQDTQAVGGFNGPGPFQILDNQLESTGENVMFGGAKTALPNVVPSDITIRGNTLFKPLSWRPGSPTYAGTNWLVKNHFELKSGRRVVFEGNIVENCWASGQNGGSVVLSVSTEGGAMLWNAVEDITIQNNIFRHIGVGITAHPRDANGGTERNIKVRNNLFEDIDHLKWGGTGTFMLLSGNVPGVVVEHNTMFSTRFSVYYGSRASVGTIFRNNISNAQMCGDSLGCGTAVFTALGTGAIVAGNVMAGVSNYGWPAGNYFPATIDAVRFVDRTTSNYALAFDSLYVKKATDGTDPGVDMQALQAAVNGAPAPPQPAVSVAVTPGSVTLNANRSVVLQATVSGTTNKAVQWRLDAAVGSINTTGTYTAPSTVTARQTVRAIATSVADTTKSATSTITIDPAPAGGVTISPATKSLVFGQPVALWPTVTGIYDQRVQWSAPAIGTMNTATTGMTTYWYLASPTGTQSNVVTVTARSVADPTKSGTATFTLVPPRVIVSMTDSPNFRPGMTKYIWGTVYDVWEAKYRGVTWTLTPNLGVIDTARGTYTAPSVITAPTSVVLKATSVVDPRVSHSITLNLIP